MTSLPLAGRVAAVAERTIALLLDSDPDPASVRERQVAALIDEAGEALHEVRRVHANTRSRGSVKEIAGELADVILAGQVAAAIWRVNVPIVEDEGRLSVLAPLPAARRVVRIAANIAPEFEPRMMRYQLVKVGGAALALAEAVGVDLSTAIPAKLAIVEARLGLPIPQETP